MNPSPEFIGWVNAIPIIVMVAGIVFAFAIIAFTGSKLGGRG